MRVSHSTTKLADTLSSNRAGLPNHQKGMSFLGVFALIAVAAFLGLFAFKVVPAHLEYMTVAKIADDVAGNAELMKQPKSKVNTYIGQAYRTNNLWDLKAEDTIKLSKDGRKGYKVEVDYEKRANLIANIYVVTKFQKEAGQP